MKTVSATSRWVLRRALPVAALAMVCVQNAGADSVAVPASADFLAAIVLNKTHDIDFTSGGGASAVTFDGTQTALNDKLLLGTDDSLGQVGTALTLPASGSASGKVTIAGTTGAAVDVTCSAAAVLSNLSDHSQTLDMDVVKIAMNTGADYASTVKSCGGVGASALAYTILSGGVGNNVILIGGRLVAKATMVAENYSTANGGAGAPVTVQVIYH
jgi:hypothetical protein